MSWQDPLVALPADLQQVWVRKMYYDTPALWYFQAATQEFTDLAAHIIVTGAGDPTVNGHYFASGSWILQHQYALAATNRWIRYNPSVNAIGIYDDVPINGGHQLYFSSLLLSCSPTFIADDGTPPAPTVAVARTLPWYMVARWRAQ